MSDLELHSFLISGLLLLVLWLGVLGITFGPSRWVALSKHDKFRVGCLLAVGVFLFSVLLSLVVAITYNYAQRTVVEDCNAKGTFIIKRGPERGRWVICEEGARLPPEADYE